MLQRLVRAACVTVPPPAGTLRTAEPSQYSGTPLNEGHRIRAQSRGKTRAPQPGRGAKATDFGSCARAQTKQKLSSGLNFLNIPKVAMGLLSHDATKPLAGGEKRRICGRTLPRRLNACFCLLVGTSRS